MHLDLGVMKRGLRRAAPLAVGAIGIAALVGSGGGVEGGNCSFFSNVCNFVIGPIDFPLPVQASAYPSFQTAQVGTSVSFTVTWSGINQPSFQWQRSSNEGTTWTDITGATTASYALPSATLLDDAALFRAVLRDGTNAAAATVSSIAARLAVSSQPGVVLQDVEFLTADWQVAATAVPASNGPTHSEEHAADGGRPGAFRRMVHTMPIGPSELTVVHVAATQRYDPALQGAIHVIDYTEDCIETANTTSSYRVSSQLVLVQGNRRYGFNALDCATPTWSTFRISSLVARDFTLLEGPACTTGESCPDFTATAAPLGFGYLRRSQATAGVAGTVTHGIDNWKVTVWRR